MSKENKRELRLNALEALLPGRRFHEITLDEVAKAAQVGKGTIYLYFQDKDALFAELVCFRLGKLQEQLAGLAGCNIKELPGRVFDLVGNFIRRHRSWFGAIGNYASHIARMTDLQYEQVKNQGADVVAALAEVMQGAMPQWSAAEARFKAQSLLWLIDGYIRSEFAGVNELPPPEELLNFFRSGAGIAEK